MKKVKQLVDMLLAIVCLNLVGCQVSNEAKPQEETKVEEKSSKVIADTQWSDTMKIHWNHRVYLPKEYEENSDKEYPVLYMLHGWGGNLTNTTDEARIDSQKILDNLIDNKEIEPMIVVFVDGFNSFYVDGPTFKMESAIVNDLIPFIDSKYKTLDNSKNRAIAGISMGGYGALNIGLSNSDMFKSIGLMSPAIWDKMEEGNLIYGSQLVDYYYENSYQNIMNDVKSKDIDIFTYHGKNDETITYDNVERFVSYSTDAGFEVKYELQDEGPHAWPTWGEMYPKVLKDISNSFNK
ncbi:MAG: alpha/beta hydrolase-fold protein [Clostridium sp.]|uniref:alpha/beta hydrolase n=1 Tax=Clostridium sp. TaxID=1506 RepID=UPI0029102DA6|nr:alpha/beta hydrolase-fold protein [Clostridium sp.]MDU5111567.1 alpha/beta hydrolase-fold protein [Clostridium sp.]